MSWMKRAQGGAPPAQGPERQPYAPPATQAQPYANQQNMYPNYQGGTTTTGNSPQQQFWQPPAQQQPQYQQYGQVYQQSDYGANANQFYQQPTQFNQNYTNQGFSNPQQGYQQNYYQNQGVQGGQQNPTPNKTHADNWEDNWDWGWEDSSKQNQKGASQNTGPQQALGAQPQQAFNNANVIEESFALTNTWNWSMEDKKDAREPPSATLQENPEPVQVNEVQPLVENHTSREQSTEKTISNLSQHPIDEVKTLNDRDVVKERLPNLALGKRFHLENLTPQWSIESQMSQESSDGPLTHSEGTYRSENQSRNSSKSSPGLNTDNSNFNYSQSGLEEAYPQNSEWSRQSDEPITVDSVQNGSRRESHDELSHSIQEMSLANHENISSNNSQLQNNYVQENMSAMLSPPSVSSASFPISVSSNVTPQSLSSLSASSMVTPPPPATSASMPPPPVTSVSLPPPPVAPVTLPPPPSSVATLPPSNYPPMSSQNPFKYAGAFSNKSTAQPYPPQMSNSNLTSPSVVNKVSQQRPVGFEANLETTPDNSERPDQPQMSAFRPMTVSQPVPDNMEVAPKNDRNEYLQTAHLSSGDYGENTDFSRNAPPPGFRRMVLGQQESEYSQNLNISGDEPPPGLARMVPGQQTETENNYNQPTDNYMDRHVDGQHTDSSGRPYRQADGQQTPDNYAQSSQSRGSERRPIGLDRMVPGEPSNDDFPQYPGSNYASTNEQRVVMGVDHDYPIPAEAGPSDVREQNVDGSDYTEQTPRNPSRNRIGARELSNDVSPDFGTVPEEQQREITMEGENLQDLSIISSVELTFSREQMLDGADETITDLGADRKTDVSDSTEHPVSSSRRQSLNRTITSGEESERDRTFKNSPRRDRDKHKSSRDRDRGRERNREKDRDRKFDREGDRRSGRDDRRSEKDRRDKDRERRDASPDTRRIRRSTRSHRYETEDTDYSDRERDRRRYREGSYTSSKPPRPDDKDRRYGDERDRNRRYNTIERERRHDDERDVASRSNRRSDRRDRYERKYREIDPNRKYGNLRREREDEERRRVVTFSSDAKTNDSSKREGETYSPSRPDSRDATATDEDLNESRRRTDRRNRHPRSDRDPYYDGYGGASGAAGGGLYGDPYLAQRQQQQYQYQYQYYEQLRLTDPAAYMEVYKQVMAGHQPPPPPSDYRPHPMHHNKLTQLYGDVPGYSSLGYDGRTEERGASVHSGRSSTTGLKGNDTYLTGYRLDAAAAGSLRDAHSMRTDFSDRDLNTDASLNLQLEESTVRSERMTPYRFSTAHIKGSISSQHLVVVVPVYPVDGAPATVRVLALPAALAHDPHTADLRAYPGPLVKGITHKKSVIEYCAAQSRAASRGVTQSGDHTDAVGCVLVWDLLALMLTQNGVVVGSDIAELLMRNTREYEYKQTTAKTCAHTESRRESSLSGEIREEQERTSSPDQPSLSTSDITHQESASSPGQSAVDEKTALDRLRDYLIYGNRQEAIEYAMCNNLWGHALQLSAYSSRRARAQVAGRFLAALARTDPLHTLYAALAATTPPAATCVSEERWGDWRPHAAIILSNTSARPDQDRQTLMQLGDSLSSRGLIYSAQFCYLSAGVPFTRHPLAPLGPAPAPGAATGAPPPRLALLLADPRATTLSQLATNRAIFATEIYEYALSLNQDYVIDELPVYKLLLACRLSDCGLYERALGYTEQAARVVTRSPPLYSTQLVASLATLADRLKYHDPGVQEEPPLLDESPGAGAAGDSGEPSPRHHQQWLDDVKNVAHMLQHKEEGGSGTAAQVSAQVTPQHYQQQQQYAQQQYGWDVQAQQQQYLQPQPQPQPQPLPLPAQPYPEPAIETTEYVEQYKQVEGSEQLEVQPPGPYDDYADQWRTQEEVLNTYADPYWQNDHTYNYAEAGAGAGAGGEDERPTITMPGAASASPSASMPLYGDYDDRPPSADQKDRDTDTPKQSSKKSDSKSKDEQNKDGKKSGWLGGILTKLSLRPPNQMILPDDKNPSIVWDAEHKRWRNTDADGEEPAQGPPPPPPRTRDLPMAPTSGSPPLQGSGGSGAPPLPPAAAPVSNIFKMQKGRHIKKSYVDVFNPSGAATRALPPAAEVLGAAAAPLAPAPNYFIPAPSSLPAQSGTYEPEPGDHPDVTYRSGI